jgi:hypothetical protein
MATMGISINLSHLKTSTFEYFVAKRPPMGDSKTYGTTKHADTMEINCDEDIQSGRFHVIATKIIEFFKKLSLKTPRKLLKNK